MEFTVTLPVAGIVLNPLLILALGWVGGFLSGLLGVGGGVIITPALMVLGVPPLVAVASQVNHSIGTCLTGLLNYRRNNDVDFHLGGILLTGGIIGAVLGVFILKWLHTHEQAIPVLTLSYIIVLGSMSFVLFRQSLKTLAHYRAAVRIIQPPAWTRFVGLKLYFTRSRIELSMILPLLTGVINGALTSSLGVGNGVFMMPVLSYLIGRTSPVIYGTTLLAGLGMSVVTTLMYAIGTHSVDMLLVFLLLGGGILGSQMGVRFGYNLPRPYIGMVGAMVILGICMRMAWNMQAGKNMGACNVSGNTLAGVPPCPEGPLFFLQYFAHDFPILNALAGIIGVILFSVILDYVFHRISLIRLPVRD